MATASAHLHAGLHAAWNRQLYRWWHQYNEQYLAGALQVPMISWAMANRAWGTGNGPGVA